MKDAYIKERRAFTLVELLIVIVMIGILASMMTLSSTEAVNSAKASNIISNLRNWRTAALAWYVDNIDAVDKGTKVFGDGSTVKSTDVAKYLNSESTPGYDLHNSDLTNKSKVGTWFVMYKGTDLTSGVADRLNARKDTVGLSGAATSKDHNAITNAVYMYVR